MKECKTAVTFLFQDAHLLNSMFLEEHALISWWVLRSYYRLSYNNLGYNFYVLHWQKPLLQWSNPCFYSHCMCFVSVKWTQGRDQTLILQVMRLECHSPLCHWFTSCKLCLFLNHSCHYSHKSQLLSHKADSKPAQHSKPTQTDCEQLEK